MLAHLLLLAQANFQAGLHQDAAVLRKAFIAIHPGLYRYNTPAQLETHFKSLEAAWAKASDLKDAYLALSEFAATVKCGHTYPNFFNQTKEVAKAVFEGKNRVPFHFRWLDGKMVVTEDLTPEQVLPKGTEIRRINGIPTAKILKTLIRVARADGNNDARRASILCVESVDRYEAFDIYLPLYFEPRSPRFSFEVKSTQRDAQVVYADALTMEDRNRSYESANTAAGENGDLWRFEILKGGVGYFRMPSWVMYNSKWDWKSFLAASFQRLADAKSSSLIFDLRGNEGGDSVGDELIAYLTGKPLQFSQYKRYTRYTTVPTNLKPYLDTWDRTFDNWSLWAEPSQYNPMANVELHRMRRWDDGKDLTIIEPKQPHFNRKTVVLVDAANSSATFQFCSMVQEQKLATLIGEPTGGNQRGINGSAFYFLRLPNSKLEIDLPLVASLPDKPMPDAGLTPDILVRPTAKDIGKGRDVVLEAAMRFLQKYR